MTTASREATERSKSAIREFYRRVRGTDSLVIEDIERDFHEMHSCMHAKSAQPDIDLSALTYSMLRQPLQVMQATKVDLMSTGATLDRSSFAKRTFAIDPQTRRRDMTFLPPDTLEIIVRDGETDLVDCVSLLTSVAIEAKKISARFEKDPQLKALAKNATPDGETPLAESDRLLLLNKVSNLLGINYVAAVKSDNALKNNLLPILGNLADHPMSKINVRVDPRFRTTTVSESAEHWCDRIVSELPRGNTPVAFISNNVSSVGNILSGAIPIYTAEILKQISDDPIRKLAPLVKDGHPGALDYAMSILFAANPQFRKEKIKFDEKQGIKHVTDNQYHTGITAQIIDVARVIRQRQIPDSITDAYKAAAIDSNLTIINIDYAFGYQGTYIMQGLCDRLRSRIKHIGILGKAGICAPDGERFDIMIPSCVLTDANGIPIPNGNQLIGADFDGYARKIHSNKPALSVRGTFLSSEESITEAVTKDDVIQLEMEAHAYLSPVHRGHLTGRLAPELRVYMGYWASDKPLGNELLAESHMERGCIPAYGLVSTMLARMFGK